jgi:thiol-disulfide isomerase/thioredoxin
MKQKLQFIVIAIFAFISFNSKAQLLNGSIASDFTFTDLNGNTQHLYSILDSGKTVFIDVSAAWCGPCWSYHTDGSLETLHDDYGPSGTNELRVMFIEGELTNTLAQLNGVNAGNTYAGSTQGDWVTGTGYPIVNLSTSTTGASAFLTNYKIGYFPTIYMICPDRTVTEVGAVSTADLYAAKTAGCVVATSAVDAKMVNALEFNRGLATCDSITPTFRFVNIGTDTLNSATITLAVDGSTQKTINWTGNLDTYESTTITGLKLGSTVAGAHTITATISNPNGVTDPSSSNNSVNASFLTYSATGAPFIVETFEASGIPNNWYIESDGSSYTWTEDIEAGYNSTNSAALYFYAIGAGQVDYLKLPPMSFAGNTTASLTFYVAYAQYSSSNADRLQVQVSVDCGETWTTKFNKAGSALKTVSPKTSSFTPASSTEWRYESVDLNSYAGQQQVLVRFKGVSDYGNNLYIDNINFSSNSVTSITESEIVNSINLYPNPASDNAFVEFDLVESATVSITIMNAVGQKVIEQHLGKINSGLQKNNINTSNLENGMYFVTINAGDKTIIKKLTINK